MTMIKTDGKIGMETINGSTSIINDEINSGTERAGCGESASDANEKKKLNLEWQQKEINPERG